jgi:hypothetical protein
MPSSTSSSEAISHPAFVPARLTASDRPGVAQPVPVRDIPAQPWSKVFIGAVVLCALMVTGWEMYWRAYGVAPSYRNTDGEWLMQRRRLDAGEGGATVLIGASRILFDTQLPVWEKITGKRPIQLALEGTSPVPIMENLAADPNFTGRLLVDVAPDIIFTGFAYRATVLPYLRDQTPSQRIGDWLSMRFLEPVFAFYDPDYALSTVVRRQPWPERPGMHSRINVRRLAVHDEDRNTQLWDKVVTDPEYRALARSIWAQDFGDPAASVKAKADPKEAQKSIDEAITKAAAAIATLRARGVRVLFLRPPSSGEYYAYEKRAFPRAKTWDPLLERTHTPGIHFEDYPELQDYDLPEWSHMSPSEADRFTAALVPIVEREFAKLEQTPSH